MSFFFFFQAEDGIRDGHVTGVQTCALPISVAGGMPIGVVCGRARLMRRFDPERPLRVAYVIGTFSAHPVVMGAMNEFLRWAVDPARAQDYEAMNRRCAEWAGRTNRRLAEAPLPLRVVHLGTVWTVLFSEPG